MILYLCIFTRKKTQKKYVIFEIYNIGNYFDSQIESIVDLPGVGSNLQDHVTTILGPFIINKPVTFNLARLMISPGTLFEYLLNGSGPLSTTVAGDAIGFIHTENIQDNLKYPPGM